MGVYHGRTSTLQGQFETTVRTAPVSPNTQLLKFSELDIGQDADLQDNPTINSQALMDKRTEMDHVVSGKGKHILCFNDIGWWLKLLLGAPTTSGAGPYVHTFTLGLADRPSALLEVALTENDAAPSTRFHRFLGNFMNALSWDVMEKDQSFQTELIGCVEVKPFPSTAFDVTPTARYPTSRACTKGGEVYDAANYGASTLGKITKASARIFNDHEGYPLADGQEGFGHVQLGQPMIEGSLSALFENATLMDHALAGTSKALKLVSKSSDGLHSLKLDCANIEFDRPHIVIPTSKGLIADGIKWRAHHVDAAAAPTVVLTNATPNYT
jgi:hypothetical protein